MSAAADAEGLVADLIRQALEVKPMLPWMFSTDLACTALVLEGIVRSAHIHLSARGDSAAALQAAREQYGCRRCGAIGSEPCRRSGGQLMPPGQFHASRRRG